MRTSVRSDEEVRVISPRAGWLDVDIAGLWRYRTLVRLFVKRDFVAMYKQTILGPLWYLIQPIANAVVFTVIFGTIAQLPTDGVPPYLFYLASTVCWGYFSTCLQSTSTTFSTNAGLFSKVYFPRLAVPVSVVISNLISFGVQVLLLLGFLAWYVISGAAVRPTPYLLMLPLLLMQMAALGLGVGLIVSALTTRYRDLAMTVGFGVSLWMYMTPIVYPFSLVPDALKPLSLLNPMTGVVEMFRRAFLGAGTLTVEQYAFGLVVTAAVLVVGVVVFSRFEKAFVDTI